VRQHIEHGEDAREAGILLLGGEPLEIHTATTSARYWLDQLDDGGYAGDLPTVILSAARAARARSRATTSRARTRSGRWLTVTAETTEGTRDGGSDVGIVVQPSRPAEIAQIVGAAHGLTPRETEVVLLIASGRTNQEIARSLGLSPYTVGDHLKRVFAKLGVVTRGELTSTLFYDYYLHRVTEDRPAGADGWFLPD
jgi:DNA-binding CsgD family transcriptional regulator